MQQCGKHQAKHTSASPLLTGWQNILASIGSNRNCHLSTVILSTNIDVDCVNHCFLTQYIFSLFHSNRPCSNNWRLIFSASASRVLKKVSKMGRSLLLTA